MTAMACTSCKERAELIARMREAYRRGDIPEAKRLFKEMVGTAIKDVEKLTKVVLRTPEGATEHFDFTSEPTQGKKPP